MTWNKKNNYNKDTNRYINVSFRPRCTLHARSTRAAIFHISKEKWSFGR